MRKHITIILLSILSLIAFGQKDTLVNNGVYESLYSFNYGQPIYVKYKLYKGGGECSRKAEHFHFRHDSIIRNLTAGNKDYEGTGFDEGHMANAEDFAFDCKKEELTFRYYNCLPQSVKLNRGIWKAHETKVRQMSQNDSLLIFCGGIFTSQSKYIKEGSKLRVPTYCYKVIISLSTHKLLDCVIFDNNDNPTEKSISLTQLEYQTKYFFERLTKFSIKQ